MKKWIHATTLPEGYLRTTKFSTPSIKTDDQRNALEALEVAITQKFDQWDKMNEITLYLTSESFWQGTIEEYPEGYYILINATRSGFQAFVDPTGTVIRKPRNLSDMIGYYNVEGYSGKVDYMSKRRTVTK